MDHRGGVHPGGDVRVLADVVTCSRCGRDYRPLRRGFCKNCYEHQRCLFGWESSLVDAEPARAHVAALLDAGLSLRRVAALAGLNRKVVQVLMHGRSDRGTGPSKTIWPATAEKILAVPIPGSAHRMAADRALMTDYGTTRRLRALVAIGYPQYYLAQRLGISPSNATRLFKPLKRARSRRRKRSRVTAATARRVEELYRELENTPGPSRSAATRARNLGWLPPVVWDEDNIDQPLPWLDRQVAHNLTESGRERRNDPLLHLSQPEPEYPDDDGREGLRGL